MTDPGPRVVLIGPMGAGKTTVAGLLAQAWGCEVRDTDQDVEVGVVAAGVDGLAEQAHTGVLARGGGALMDPATREVLVGQGVVCLTVGLADAAKRVGLGQGRPLLVGNIRSRIKSILTERLPIYAAVASHVVDTDGRPAEEVADEVRAWVEADEADEADPTDEAGDA